MQQVTQHRSGSWIENPEGDKITRYTISTNGYLTRISPKSQAKEWSHDTHTYKHTYKYKTQFPRWRPNQSGIWEVVIHDNILQHFLKKWLFSTFRDSNPQAGRKPTTFTNANINSPPNISKISKHRWIF